MFEPEICDECQTELRDDEFNEDEDGHVLCDDCAREQGIEVKDKSEYDEED